MSVDGHLNCFHFLAIMNTVAVNVCVQVFVWREVFNYLGYIARDGIPGSYGNLMFSFLRSCQTLPKWPCQFTFPTAGCEGSNFSTPLPILASLLVYSPASRWEVVCHCGFVFFQRRIFT